jgi:hypothetical protein
MTLSNVRISKPLCSFFKKCFMDENRGFRSMNVYVLKSDPKWFKSDLNRKSTLILSEKTAWKRKTSEYFN